MKTYFLSIIFAVVLIFGISEANAGVRFSIQVGPPIYSPPYYPGYLRPNYSFYPRYSYPYQSYRYYSRPPCSPNHYHNYRRY